MTEPAITIAVPYYERRKYLRRAVDSVLAQTIDNWRLVICDNCSSHDFAEELAASLEDDRVTYFRESTRVSRAECFNRGLKLAQADLVVLLHDDDELLPGYCELMLNSAEQYPTAAAFYCHAQIIGENSKPVFSLRDNLKAIFTGSQVGATRLLEGEKAATALLRANFIYGPSVCFRKSLLGGRRFNTKWDQVLDIDMHVRLLMDEKTLLGLAPVAYCYRRHAGQGTAENLQSMRYFEEEVALFEELAILADSLNWPKVAKAARQKRVTKLQLLYQCIANGFQFRWRAFGRNLAFLWRIQ